MNAWMNAGALSLGVRWLGTIFVRSPPEADVVPALRGSTTYGRADLLERMILHSTSRHPPFLASASASSALKRYARV